MNITDKFKAEREARERDRDVNAAYAAARERREREAQKKREEQAREEFNSGKPNPVPVKNNIAWGNAIGGVLILAFVAAPILWMNSCLNRMDERIAERAANPEVMVDMTCAYGGDSTGEWESFQISKRFVKRGLKSPATAKFPWTEFTAAMVGRTSDSNCRWEVVSWVDAQNGFGATVRTHYKAALTYNGSSWKLESLSTW